MGLKVRAKAPLRLGLAGGGTDVSPYSDQFGGCVLNATIDLYSHCTIELLDVPRLEFIATDLDQRVELPLQAEVPLEGPLLLHRAIYNRVIRDFRGAQPVPVRVTTYSDAPPGSGLGTSSTMVVAVLTAFQELLRLPLGEYDSAHLAYVIERQDCRLSGGKQDQYAATFGGFNFMEFGAQDKVIINPLRIRDAIVNELHARTLLYFTGQSRESAHIIDQQISAVRQEHPQSVDSMHEIKRIAYDMKERLLVNDVDGVCSLLRESWTAKKGMAAAISNSHIDRIADRAMEGGALAVKVSGAGGGGFMMIFADPVRRLQVQRSLEREEGYFVKFSFSSTGAQSWSL